jgi:hypothetical protein
VARSHQGSAHGYRRKAYHLLKAWHHQMDWKLFSTWSFLEDSNKSLLAIGTRFVIVVTRFRLKYLPINITFDKKIRVPNFWERKAHVQQLEKKIKGFAVVFLIGYSCIIFLTLWLCQLLLWATKLIRLGIIDESLWNYLNHVTTCSSFIQ